jgi:hypothetical protein
VCLVRADDHVGDVGVGEAQLLLPAWSPGAFLTPAVSGKISLLETGLSNPLQLGWQEQRVGAETLSRRVGNNPPRFLDFLSTHNQFKLVRSVLDEVEYYAIHTRDVADRLVSNFDPGTFCKLHSLVEPKCVARFLYDLETRLLSLISDPENPIYLAYAGECRYEVVEARSSCCNSLGSALASLLEVLITSNSFGSTKII